MPPQIVPAALNHRGLHTLEKVVGVVGEELLVVGQTEELLLPVFGQGGWQQSVLCNQSVL